MRRVGFFRLAMLATAGVALICVLAAAVYALRYALVALGYEVPPQVFLVVLLATLGGGFGLVAKLTMRPLGSKGGT